jgi:GxxExxY protein
VNRRGAEGAEGERGWAEPDEALNRLSESVIGAAIEVHRSLGPGFLESFYEEALCREMSDRGVAFRRQVAVDVLYKGAPIGEARLDLLVERRLLVELKATERWAPIHMAQVLSYMKATGLTLGLLINPSATSAPLRFPTKRSSRSWCQRALLSPLRRSIRDGRSKF